jgi:hypothetical protein
MFNFLKKDAFWLGLLLGVVVPLVLYAILHYINIFIVNKVNNRPYLTDATVQIISLAANLIVMRYYLINRKADKTGRGILLVTFIAGIAFFVVNL